MASRRSALVIGDLRGGRNGADPPMSLPDNQVVEALNVDFFYGTLGNKRGGASALSLTGANFTGIVSSLIMHLPGATLSLRELWGFDDASPVVVGRLAGSATWSNPTCQDAFTNGIGIHGASLNGWLFLTGDTAVDRLHVWDTSTVRRVGMATSAAPTVATMGGAGKTFTRWYRTRYVTLSGTTVIRMSEASSAVSLAITDDAGVTVTKPAAINEGETHWDVEYADLEAGPWYRATRLPIATTTYSDTATDISTLNPSAVAGAQTPPTSWKYIIADENRLLGAGSYETTSGNKQSRVWFTPVFGTSTASTTTGGDLERVPNQLDQENWIDLDEQNGGGITGFGGPIQGYIYAFKERQIWKLIRTGRSVAPYRPLPLTKVVGCIRQESIVTAEDEIGNPALYFLSHRGPMRVGSGGVEYLGNDIEDVWETFSPAATNVTAHGVYHSDKHQVWWWLATGTNDPDLKVVYDVRLGSASVEGVLGGWVVHDGLSANARCSVLFANTVGTAMSLDAKPYLGRSSGTALWKADTGTDDAGTAFQAYLDTKLYTPGQLTNKFGVEMAILVAEAASGVSIRLTTIPDFGAGVSKTSTQALTPAGSESRVIRKFEQSELSGLTAVQFRIGDAAAVSNAWTLDALSVPMRLEEDR